MATNLKEVKLRFIEGENEGIEIRLEVPREVVLGRGEDCDIYLGEKKISRRHARLITSKGGLVVEDLKSTNGTFVNGKRINRETLANEDSVRTGTSVFQIDFIYEDSTAAKPASKATEKLGGNTAPLPNKGPDSAYGAGGKRLPQDELSMPELSASDASDAISLASSSSLSSSQNSSSSASSGISLEFPSQPLPLSKPVAKSSAAEVEIDLDFEPQPAKQPVARSSGKKAAADEVSGFDINLEVAPEPVAKASKAVAVEGSESRRKGGLSGNLSAMALADLLQTISNGRRSGILKIAGPQKGQIFIQEGKLSYACLEQGATAEKALYRMLAWKEAEFEMVALPEKFVAPKSLGKPLDSTTENLLIEGFRQLDELENLRKTLPQAEAKLTLNAKMDSPLSRLHPRVLDVLQLILKNGRYDKVLDESSTSDLDTAKMVYYLIKKGYIEVS